MTKNLLIISLFIFTGLKLSAQCTPDNTIVKPGFYPSKLPDAVLAVAYNEVIQFKIIKDTTVIVFGSPAKATIDSATITEVKGMPDGLSFQLNKISKTYTPAETGCALIGGTPTKSGTFTLQIILKIYAKIGSFAISQPDTIENFSIHVKSSAEIKPIYTKSNLVYPNPLKEDRLQINSNLILPGTVISIFNIHGQLIASEIYKTDQEFISFKYPRGIYWIRTENSGKLQMMKLVKE